MKAVRSAGAAGWFVSRKVLSFLWLAIVSPGYYFYFAHWNGHNIHYFSCFVAEKSGFYFPLNCILIVVFVGDRFNNVMFA